MNKRSLLGLLLLVTVLAISACTVSSYNCSDGTTVSDPSLCNVTEDLCDEIGYPGAEVECESGVAAFCYITISGDTRVEYEVGFQSKYGYDVITTTSGLRTRIGFVEDMGDVKLTPVIRGQGFCTYREVIVKQNSFKHSSLE